MRLVRLSAVIGVALLFDGLTAGCVANVAISQGGHPASRSAVAISVPAYITAGPDGALWFTNLGNKANHGSIGRITTSGKVTIYTGGGIDAPAGITVGPDGALWFTNSAGNSIGRITTSGKISDYTATGVANPIGITNGPDHVLWFTDALQPRLGGCDHHQREDHRAHQLLTSTIQQGSRLVLTGICGSPTPVPRPPGARSLGSTRTARSRNSPIATLTSPLGSRRDQTRRFGSPTTVATPSDASRRAGRAGSSPGRASTSRIRSRPDPTEPFGSPITPTTRSGASARMAK